MSRIIERVSIRGVTSNLTVRNLAAFATTLLLSADSSRSRFVSLSVDLFSKSRYKNKILRLYNNACINIPLCVYMIYEKLCNQIFDRIYKVPPLSRRKTIIAGMNHGQCSKVRNYDRGEWFKSYVWLPENFWKTRRPHRLYESYVPRSIHEKDMNVCITSRAQLVATNMKVIFNLYRLGLKENV